MEDEQYKAKVLTVRQYGDTQSSEKEAIKQSKQMKVKNQEHKDEEFTLSITTSATWIEAWPKNTNPTQPTATTTCAAVSSISQTQPQRTKQTSVRWQLSKASALAAIQEIIQHGKLKITCKMWKKNE